MPGLMTSDGMYKYYMHNMYIYIYILYVYIHIVIKLMR